VILIGFAIGFIVGAALALEAGRIIYNRKMDEIAKHAQAIKAMVLAMDPQPSQPGGEPQ